MQNATVAAASSAEPEMRSDRFPFGYHSFSSLASPVALPCLIHSRECKFFQVEDWIRSGLVEKQECCVSNNSARRRYAYFFPSAQSAPLMWCNRHLPRMGSTLPSFASCHFSKLKWTLVKIKFRMDRESIILRLVCIPSQIFAQRDTLISSFGILMNTRQMEISHSYHCYCWICAGLDLKRRTVSKICGR